MSECKCICCHPDAELQERMIKGYKYNENRKNPWVFVPREPATFGHVVVVSGKHYEDISDIAQDVKHLEEIMKVVTELASKMKNYLKLNGEENGKKCKRIYIVSECETSNFHLHIHLIPRFKGDKKGHMFLFERELEEARWMLEKDKKEDKIRDMYNRIGTAEGILNFHKQLICSNEWVRLNYERENFIINTREKIEEILEKKDP